MLEFRLPTSNPRLRSSLRCLARAFSKRVVVRSAIALCALAASAHAQAATVFINEIHYDNTGTDTGEAIEIAGPAGTDLSGWSLVLYNGNGGAPYDTVTLTGVIPNQQGGLGTVFVSYPSNGIQNGSPDGIALVNASSAVVQFLSYEGTFAAVGGPADGMLSVDIGVSETGTEPIGQSLQLTGTGGTSDDFTWAAPMSATFGGVNTGQTFTGGVATTPVINEFVANHTGTDTHEFVEIFGDPSSDYSAFSILQIEGDSGGQGTIDSVFPVGATDAGGFWSTGFLGNVIENGSVTLLLVEDFTGAVGDDVDTDDDGTIDTTFWSAIIDSVAVSDGGAGDSLYSPAVLGPGFGGDPFTPGGASRIPDGTDTDAPADWLRNDFDGAGLPGFSGTPMPGEAFNTPGAVNAAVPAPTPSLVINEIDYDQPGTDDAEFIEIKNTGASSANLSGVDVVLVNGNGGGASIYNTISLPAVSLAAGDYFVVCGNAANTINCDLDVSQDTNLIQNGAPDAVALVSGSTILDAVSYEGDTGAPYTEGSGSGLEDDSSVAFLGISRFPDGVDTDQNNVDLSPRCITPGAANSASSTGCTVPVRSALVINEIDYDQPGTDTAEFIELKNVSSAPVDLDPYELRLVNGNGGGASVYQAIDLPAVLLAPGDYFVICGDAASTPNCDLDVSPDSNLIQNGAPDAVGLALGGTVVDAVSYEGDTGAPYTEGSGSGLEDDSNVAFLGISRLPDGADTDQNNVDFSSRCITPGGPNTSFSSNCTSSGPVFEIDEIQGSGLTSPFVGGVLTTKDNIVTALAADGFFIQTPDARADASADTSNGLFVFTGGTPTVAVGDQVDVTGTVAEYFDFTEIAGGPVVSVDSSGNPLPAAVTFDATVPSPDPTAPSCAIEYECYEGMRIRISGGTVTGPNQRFGTDPIAEVYVVAGPLRAFREPGILYPGLPGLPVWDGNPEVFELDPDRLGLPNQIIPAGSHFDAEGVLGYEFGGYELWPTSLSVTPTTLPRPVSPRQSGEFSVGSLNMLRFFDDVDDPPSVNFEGGVRDDTVVSTAEFARRRAKFVRYILEVLDAPDILAVEEVEKLENLEVLAADIAAADPTVHYTAYLFEGNDIGTIDVGFLVRDSVQVDSVTQLGLTETYVNPLNGDPELLHDRPPLLLEGRYTRGGADFPIKAMVVHNRSLSSIDDPVDGPRVRQKRLEQALSIARKVQELQTANPDVHLVVLGDFNAFEFTDGYVDAVGQIAGAFDPADNLLSGPDLVDPNLTVQTLGVPAGERYSYNFEGSAQTIDHALTSTRLTPLVRGLEYGRGNSDAAVDLINDATTPLRSSDHDGLVLRIFADSDGDGVADQDDACPGTVVPEGVPTVALGVNRYALVDADRTFDTALPPGRSRGPGDTFTLDDTAGCSCEQIISTLRLGEGHTKFGCSVGVMRDWVRSVGP
jgi:predicted extracellular nuclease